MDEIGETTDLRIDQTEVDPGRDEESGRPDTSILKDASPANGGTPETSNAETSVEPRFVNQRFIPPDEEEATLREEEAATSLSLESDSLTSQAESEDEPKTDEDISTESQEEHQKTHQKLHAEIPSSLRSDLVGAATTSDIGDTRSISQRMRKRKAKIPDGKKQVRVNFLECAPEEIPMIESLNSDIPNNFKDVQRSKDKDKWMEAIAVELEAHAKLGTWDQKGTSVNRHVDNRTIPTRWVFNKKGVHGEVFKARLVARGDVQHTSTYTDTYSPTLRLECLRLILSVAVERNLHISQLDVKTAYLNAQLPEEVYISAPDGSGEPPGTVLRLRRALYGLKQSGLLWHNTLKEFLVSKGFEVSHIAPSVFKRGETILAVFVDDILITSKKEQHIRETEKMLAGRFEIKVIPGVPTDNGSGEVVRQLLGHEIHERRDKRGVLSSVKITKSAYLEKVQEMYKLPGKSKLPLETNFYFEKDKERLELPPKLLRRRIKTFQKAIGIMLYVTTTVRPDAAYAAQYLARYATYPHEKIWEAIQKTLDYLVATKDVGIVYRRGDKRPSQLSQIEIFTDSDYSSDPETRKSQNGYVSMLNGGPISWKTKPTELTCQSSAEAEYQALVLGSNESTWLTQGLRFVSGASKIPTPLFLVDNMSAIDIALKDGLSGRTKHFDVRLHVIRDRVKAKTLVVKHVKGELQLADVLTKPVEKRVMDRIRPLLLQN